MGVARFNLFRGIPMRVLVLLCFMGSSSLGCKEVDQGIQKQSAQYTVAALYSIVKQAGSKEQQPAPASGKTEVGSQKQSVPVFSQPTDAKLAALADGPLGGITIVPLRNDPSLPINGNYLVLFVSPEGTYASVDNGCIGWVNTQKSEPSVLTFGVDDLVAQAFPRLPRKLCSEFAVRYEDNGIVRLAKDKQPGWKYNVVARIPLGAPDWTLEVFNRYAVKGIRLGPADVDSKTVGSSASNSQYLIDGYLRSYVKPSDGSRDVINGRLAAQEVTGWSSDVFVHLDARIQLSQISSTSGYREAVREKYTDSPSLLQSESLYWMYDLRGHLLREQDATTSNCMATYKIWMPFDAFFFRNSDIGPWGCALLVEVSYPNPEIVKTVQSYRIQEFSGFSWALSHFKSRLAEVRKHQEAVAGYQPAKPHL
ncbi:MAG: hypothetical protein HP496_16945 [Nitrospira sp.]|nr:hypothetical protein [Nitrospira sp.]